MLNGFFQNEYVLATLVFVIFYLIGKLVHVGVRKFLVNWVPEDGQVVQSIERPVHAFIVVFGVFMALRQLTELNGIWPTIKDAFFVVFLLIAATIVTRALQAFIDKYLKVKRQYERIPQLINKIILITVYVVALLMILGYFEIEITPIIATLGIGGLAVGLALQNTLSNFFAGLHIISDQPVSVGHFIELDNNISGYVEDIGWRSTRIRTLPNTIVVVPNAKLAESVIINDSLPQKEMSFWLDCGVAYGSDLDKVEKAALKVAKKIQKTVEGAVEDYEPAMRFTEFGESNIKFITILRIKKYTDKFTVRHAFIKALKKEFDKQKIEISFPVRKIVQAKKR